MSTHDPLDARGEDRRKGDGADEEGQGEDRRKGDAADEEGQGEERPEGEGGGGERSRREDARPPGEDGPPGDEEDRPGEQDRRRFLARLGMGLGAAAGAVAAVPWLAVFLNPVQRRDPDAWMTVGDVDEFPVGTTVQVNYLETAPLPWAGFSARSAAWVRRDGPDLFTAFSSYCTHIGCPVRWDPGARLFLCPCHGGAFYDDGSVAAGPPPRPLDRFPIRVRDGVVELRPEGVPPPRG